MDILEIYIDRNSYDDFRNGDRILHIEDSSTGIDGVRMICEENNMSIFAGIRTISQTGFRSQSDEFTESEVELLNPIFSSYSKV